MNAVEPLADAVTGGVIAGAVEPSAGPRVDADGHTQETACLNCGTALVGEHCHACGQRAHVHRSLSAFAHDLLHGVFHFEGKVWRTLPMLAWRPGELTRRYIDGQRASFVSPIALFLFSVFLMFAALSFSGWGVRTDLGETAEFRSGLAKAEADIQKLQARRNAAAGRGQDTAQLDEQLRAAREEASLMRAVEEKGVVGGGVARLSDDVPAWLRNPIERAGRNPELLFFKLKTNAYKFSWMLIPLSVPFLWLLFPFNRRFRMYDHTVFVTYSLSFMTLLTILFVVLDGLNVPGSALLLLVPPIHMYRQLKGAYVLTRLSALVRTAVLLFFAVIASWLFALILLALGVFD